MMRNVISTVFSKIRKNEQPPQFAQKIDTVLRTLDANEAGELVPWDWHALHQLSRSRYMEIRALLENPLGPSIHITTEELANVVNGREDIPLPEWVNNLAFEAELDSLIEHSSTVWVCSQCDSIVSFFSVPDQNLLPDLLKDLFAVWAKEKTPCPFCGTITILLVDAKALKKGEKVRFSLNPSLTLSQKRPEVEGSAVDSEASSTSELSRNEKYLDEILHKEYSIPQNQGTDVLELSEQGAQDGTDGFFSVIESWPDENGFLPIPRHIPSDERKPLLRSFSLRPRYQVAGSNILGRIWDSVKLMVGDNYPAFTEVAVGMAPSHRHSLSASAHLGDASEMAIVLDFELFNKLYTLNHLLSLLFDNEHQGIWSRRDIAINLMCELTSRPIGPTKAKIIPRDYQTQKQFWTAHIISNAQQQFAILHELGHLADRKTLPLLDHHSLKDSMQKSKAMEMWADRWAIDIIIKKGDDFYIPWLQYRSIFWLFEYWYMMAAISKEKNAFYQSSRTRWDAIEALLRKEGADLTGLDRRSLRRFIDYAISIIG